MQATPLFLGACALASVAGVISGTTIDTHPIQRGGIGMEEIARPSIAFGASDIGLSDQVALPDHYAMRTPEGRFEAAELSNRGLYAQRRFGWREATYAPPTEPALSEPEGDPDWSASAGDLEVATPSPGSEQRSNQPVTLPPLDGQARTIDVQSELISQAG